MLKYELPCPYSTLDGCRMLCFSVGSSRNTYFHLRDDLGMVLHDGCRPSRPQVRADLAPEERLIKTIRSAEALRVRG